MLINIKPESDFNRLRKTLLLQGKADRVPLFDFNIHDTIKEKGNSEAAANSKG